MSRYTGPRLKILRALGVDLPGLSRKSMEDRPHPPGQHGARKVQARKSEFGLQLMEKQKLRYHYGLSERQLRRVVVEAKRQQGATGDRIVELLERRLDNLVFRAARQLVRHGHITVTGRRATIPSMRLRAGDAFGPGTGEKAQQLVRVSLAETALERPQWIAFDADTTNARLAHSPEGGDSAPFPLDLQRVVEYYAKRL